MKIKKFFEQDENLSLSEDKIKEMIDKISEISSLIDNKKVDITSMLNSLSNLKSKSKKSNTQIDDSYLYLESISNKIDDIISTFDVINNNLNDYYESGERYLY
jgi:hypothetical protein